MDFSFGNPLIDYVERGDIVTVQKLLAEGVNVNSRGEFGVTALMRAVYRGDNNMVELLLKHGADVDIHDIGGATALHIASRQGRAEMIPILHAKSAFGEQQDLEGYTPQKRAVVAKKTKVVEAFARLNPAPVTTTTSEIKVISDEPVYQGVAAKAEEVVVEEKVSPILLSTPALPQQSLPIDDSFDNLLTQKSAHDVAPAQTRKRKIKVFSAEQLADEALAEEALQFSNDAPKHSLRMIIEKIKTEKQLDTLLNKLQNNQKIKNKHFSIQIKEDKGIISHAIEINDFTTIEEIISACKAVKRFDSQLLCYSLNN